MAVDSYLSYEQDSLLRVRFWRVITQNNLPTTSANSKRELCRTPRSDVR